MTRWCGPGEHSVAEHEAQIIGGTETGSGPGAPAYACHTHIREQGIVPTVASFIGRRDNAPIATGPRP